MKLVLPICCFCEKVRDDTGTGPGEGLWQDMSTYMAERGMRPLDTGFAYGCCPDCLKNDPHATAFRTRRIQSGVAIRGNGVSPG